MNNKTSKLIASGLGHIAWYANRMARRLTQENPRSLLIEQQEELSLYRTVSGDLFWLDPSGYVGRCIVESGVFEPWSTKVVHALVKSGGTVLDVGANIGYYTVLLSRLAGRDGRILAFEPTANFRKILSMNIAVNNLNNVEVIPAGLSDKSQKLDIYLTVDTATLHPSDSKKETDRKNDSNREVIELITLDDYIRRNPLERIDFIKIDVDGHEPSILRGAWETLEKYHPVVLLEVNHVSYHRAGYAAWDLYREIKGKGWYVYREDGLKEVLNEDDFLIHCANFRNGSNIIISKTPVNAPSEWSQPDL